MKKIALFLFSLIILFSLSGCYADNTVEEISEESTEEYEDFLECNKCNNSIEYEEYIETDNRDFLCISCAFNKGYRKCKGCELYFISDSALDSTSYYCSSCVDDHASGCHLCGAGPLDYDQLVKFTVENEPCYMCVYCCADYFKNVEQMKPCYYCIECGEIFSGDYYFHFVYEGQTICKSCIKECGYRKCKICNKYFDEGEDSVCGYCLETGVAQ